MTEGSFFQTGRLKSVQWAGPYFSLPADPRSAYQTRIMNDVASQPHSDPSVAPSTGHPIPSLLKAAREVVRSYFGYSELRPHQTDVLTHVLSGEDCLAVLPTGSGKTLCYAIPALVRPGLVLVVSPLIALMRDQARKFASHGIRCTFLDSHQSFSEKEEALHDLMSGESRILLVSPERLARDDFRERLKTLPLQLVAIDEAHCISHWGAHFRPDYRHLGSYLADLPPVQKLAVTATATSRVRTDIAHTLRLHRPALVWADFARPNLNLKILRISKVADQLTALLHAVKNSLSSGSGIVYAPTRKVVRDIHRMLVNAGIRAGLYHAGMPHDERLANQQAFMDERIQVVVATNAFGLGIDKANIRFVHHAGLPGSLEQYVQEIGRAGRDGKMSQCSLIFGPRDFHIHKFMIDKAYPEAHVLRDILEVSRAFVSGPIGQTLSSLLGHLKTEIRGAISTGDDTLAQGVEVLCREGLLTKLRSQGGYPQHDFYGTMIAEGGRHDEAFLRDYPLRKMDDVAKLEAMRAFAESSGDPLLFLDLYFRKTS